LKFLAGFGGGILVSAIVWPLVFRAPGADLAEIAMWVLPLLKLAVAAGLLRVPSLRLAGGGVLASLAVGFLIFFGVCANNLK
jgi:hypothetical protein